MNYRTLNGRPQSFRHVLFMLFLSLFTLPAFTQIGTGGFNETWIQLCPLSSDWQTLYTFTGGTLANNTEVRWMKFDGTSWTDDGPANFTVSPPSGSTVNQFSLRVRFTGAETGNNVFISTTIQSSSPVFGTGSGAASKGEGAYALRLVSNGNTIYDVDLPMFFEQGVRPAVKINGQEGDDLNIEDLTVLEGCANQVLLQTFSGCQSDDMTLTITEVDAFEADQANWPFRLPIGAGAFFGPTTMNTAQVNALNGSGLDILGLLGPSPGGKTFRISLTMNAYGTGKTSHTRMHVKEGTWDLRMKDNDNDNGSEPFDPFDDDLFRSTDIWNKLSDTDPMFWDDGEHDAPDHVTVDENTNKLMVRIENHGCTESESVPLRLFWTRARFPEYWEEHWIYSLSDNVETSAQPPFDDVAAGSEITIVNPTMADPYNDNQDPFMVPPLTPNQVWPMTFNDDAVDWYPPNPADFDASNGQMLGLGRPIICLLAILNEKSSAKDPITWEPTTTQQPIKDYVRNNNNVITRNTHMVDDQTFIVAPGNGTWNYGFSTMGVTHNPQPDEEGNTEGPITTTICLEQLPTSYADDYLDYGTIELGMTDDLFNSWQSGGEQEVNLPEIDPGLFDLQANTGCVSNIVVDPGMSEQVGVRFWGDESNLPTQDLEYTFKLSISRSNGTQEVSCLLDITMPANSPLGGSKREIEYTVREVAKERVLIFPNPANDLLHLRFPSTDLTESATFDMEVLNMAGQVVMSQNTLEMNADHKISIQDLDHGVYLMSITAAGETSVHRVVKK